MTLSLTKNCQEDIGYITVVDKKGNSLITKQVSGKEYDELLKDWEGSQNIHVEETKTFFGTDTVNYIPTFTVKDR